MTTESKAREFWIVARSAFHDSRAHEDENLIRKYHQYIRHSEVVHVIEKSAYDEMTSQRDDFWKQIQRLEQNCTDFRDKKDQLQAELKAKNELLRECEKALEMIATNIKRESKYLHWTSVDIAKEMLQKLREGKP